MRDDVTVAPEALMLFAAGRGTRMAPLTDRRPKPLIEVAGETLLDRALRLAATGGARRIVVNTHHLGRQIVDHLAGRDVAISDESDALLETGGGLPFRCRVGGRVIVPRMGEHDRQGFGQGLGRAAGLPLLVPLRLDDEG